MANCCRRFIITVLFNTTRAEAMTVINRMLHRGVDADGVMAGFKAWPDNDSTECTTTKRSRPPTTTSIPEPVHQKNERA